MTADPLATVTIEDPGSELQATFAPGAGMVCCSLRHRDAELLATNAGLEAYAERGKTMGIPLLYPWANRLAAFDYSVAEQTVAVPRDGDRIALDQNGLPIHGVIGGRMAWQLAPLDGQNPSSLRASLRWSEREPALFDVFPFPHELLYEASLADGALTIAVTVTANGDRPVPVAFGFHPYLAPAGTPREQWLIELPAMRHLALDGHQIPTGPDGDRAPARTFALAAEQFDDGFDSVDEDASFSVQAARRELTLSFLEGFRFAQVYAPLGGQFICFEPMTAPTNSLRSHSGLPLLAPGERYRSAFSVSVREPSSARSHQA